METENKYYLLNLPKGTMMYFIQCDRVGKHICASEVKYLGFSKTTIDYYDSDPHIRPEYQHMPIPAVNITFEYNNNIITFTIDDHSAWSHFKNIRRFITDEHLSLGRAKDPYLDLYFTTSKNKFDNKIKEWKEHKRIDES